MIISHRTGGGEGVRAVLQAVTSGNSLKHAGFVRPGVPYDIVKSFAYGLDYTTESSTTQ
jgi:hypothetical protein